MHEIIYLYDEGCYGVLIQLNAGWSIVQYAIDGIEFEVQVDNDDYEIRGDDYQIDPDP